MLAEARQAVAFLRSRGEPLSQWLAGEVRFRGLKENAAILAAMEVSEQHERTAIAESYRERYPQRTEQLDEIVAWL